VRCVDGSGGQQPVTEHREERLPEVDSEKDDRKVFHFAGLNEHQRLEDLVERSKAARKRHEGVRVLHEHQLANEEVPKLDHAIEIWVRPLLLGELNVAAY